MRAIDLEAVVHLYDMAPARGCRLCRRHFLQQFNLINGCLSVVTSGLHDLQCHVAILSMCV